MNRILLSLILVSLLFSCASRKYAGSEKYKENNTAYITSNESTQFDIQVKSKNVHVTKNSDKLITIEKYRFWKLPSWADNSVTIMPNSSRQVELKLVGFGLKGPKIQLNHVKYESVNLEIKRRVRFDALAKDVALGLFTYGIPIIINVFKSDF